MPCRSEAPLVAIRKPAPARWPTTVGPDQPGEGCTATPTGLSITTMESSSWMILMPSTISGTTRAGRPRGDVTSSTAPGQHPVALADGGAVDLDVARGDQLGGAGAGEPEHPRHGGVDALAREAVGHRQDAVVGCGAHALVPARALAGSAVRRRRSGCRGTPAPGSAPAATLMHMSATLKTGQLRQHQEVDDVAAQRPRRPEQPVGQVAGHARRAAGRGRPPSSDVADPAAEVEHHQHGDERDAAEHDGVLGPGAERRTRVAGQVQDQQLADQRTSGRPSSRATASTLVPRSTAYAASATRAKSAAAVRGSGVGSGRVGLGVVASATFLALLACQAQCGTRETP